MQTTYKATVAYTRTRTFTYFDLSMQYSTYILSMMYKICEHELKVNIKRYVQNFNLQTQTLKCVLCEYRYMVILINIYLKLTHNTVNIDKLFMIKDNFNN